MEVFALTSGVIFVLILIAIGYYYRHKKNSEEFFMAGRNAGAIRIATSVFTLFGAGEIVTLTAFVYFYGMSGFSLFLGIIMGFFAMVFLAERIRKDSDTYKPYTQTDYMRKFLGPKSEKMSLILSIVAIGSLLIIQLVVGGLLISTLTGLSYITSVILISLVITVYLTLGGFNSVLTTDVLQAFSMIVLIALLVLLYNPSGSSIPELITLSEGVIPPIDFVALLFLGFFAVMGGADVYQRVFSSKSNKEAKKGLKLAGIMWLVFGSLMLFLGLKILSQFPLADPNNAFFDFLSSGLSPVLLTLLSVFILASIFSTADTELFLSSILVGKLILKKKTLDARIGRILVWLIILIGAIVAIFFNNLVDIFYLVLFTLMVMGPVMLARLFGRGNDALAFTGMLLSSIIIILLAVFDLVTGLYPLLILIPTLITFLVPARK